MEETTMTTGQALAIIEEIKEHKVQTQACVTSMKAAINILAGSWARRPE